MNSILPYFRASWWRAAGLVAILTCSLVGASSVLAQSGDKSLVSDHIVTIYDQNNKRVVLTKAQTVRQTLQQAHIALAPQDRVEPSIDTKYVTGDYTVNIYRAYPVVVVDGMKRQLVMTPYRSPQDITKHAGIATRDEDNLRLEQSPDALADGASTKLTISRATPLTLMLYGARSQVYTQATTVDEFLREKNIKLAVNDTVSLASNTTITPNMTIEIWRDGAQTVTETRDIAFAVRQVMEVDKPVGYHAVKTPGVAGKKNVVYQVVRERGQEISRKEIQSVVITQPQDQVEIIGNKPTNPLSKNKGAQQYTDSRGVTHRETYYDLPMSMVMSACGGGDYTIRSDGAKVDKDGYILIAANLGNYPRCSIVETSMGLGKVYDTGGFAAAHPHGFDLATDWTNGDGR